MPRRRAPPPPLTRADLDGTSFAAAADALLVKNGGGWSALLPVAALASGDLSAAAVERIRASVAAGHEGARLLDLKGEADALYASYLRQAVQLALAGFIAIVALLLIALRSPGRVARVLAPLALSVVTVAALLSGLGYQLGILHIVGMLLIVAVGSNYALFFDRNSADPQHGSQALTLASLLVANLATVLAFGVLACSRVPVLADLGQTVAPGALLALVFAAILSRTAAGSRLLQVRHERRPRARQSGLQRAAAHRDADAGLLRAGGLCRGRLCQCGAQALPAHRPGVRAG